MNEVRAAIEAVNAASLDWMKHDPIYQKLSECLRHLKIAERKMEKEIERSMVLRGK